MVPPTGPDDNTSLFGSGQGAFDDLAPERARHLAGIDEAGLGPILGPLCLGWSSLERRGRVDDPWTLLAPAVGATLKSPGASLCVADSKVLFSRDALGHARLETTALAFLRATHRAPLSTVRALFALGPMARRAPWSQAPWAPELDLELPAFAPEAKLEGALEELQKSLSKGRVVLNNGGVRVVSAAELNQSFAATESKGLTVWLEVQRILARLWRDAGPDGVHITVDRLGGRSYYAGLLREGFPGAQVTVLAEGRELSDYGLEGQGRRMRVAFRPKADQTSFPVALASCYAKYSRELAMGAFNRTFLALDPNLKGTAGYFTDGRRWLVDAAPAIHRSGFEIDSLVRRR